MIQMKNFKWIIHWEIIYRKIIGICRRLSDRSAIVGGGGIWFVHNREKASGTNWCSSLPGTWNKSKSLSCKHSFHRKTLPVKHYFMWDSYGQFSGWNIYCLIDLQIALRHSICHSTLSPLSTSSTEIRWGICWKIEWRGLVHSSSCTCSHRYHSQMHRSEVSEMQCPLRSKALDNWILRLYRSVMLLYSPPSKSTSLNTCTSLCL